MGVYLRILVLDATDEGGNRVAVERCQTHETGILNDDLDVVRSLGDALCNARLDDGWVAPRDDGLFGDSEPDYGVHLAARLGGQPGREYLPPMGVMILLIFLAQVLSVLGLGPWFPWAAPALLSGAAGSEVQNLGVGTYLLLVVAVVAGGITSVIAWWRADNQI